MFALVDCNNFYVSCERLFRPNLNNKPIVVLSNNDGCVISRSNEAKALGIAMGIPFFKIKFLCKHHQVHVFSSNYALYGDLSNRVMSTIKRYWKKMEIYSIDEAFLDLSELTIAQQEAFSNHLQKRILKETGIPTSIGLGPTKTLAKLANYMAKKRLKTPVVHFVGLENELATIDVSEVWGVGRQWHKALVKAGIYTAADLAKADLRFIRDTFNVILMRTSMELRGTACSALTTPEKHKSILSSRSFSHLQTEYQALSEAISSHCSRVYTKMRAQQSLTLHLSVFVQSHRHRKDLPQYSNSISFKLIQGTDDLRYLTQVAKFYLKKIYKKGIHYQKVGVLASNLIDKKHHQMDMFNPSTPEDDVKTEKILSVFDAINLKYGARSVYLAAEGSQQSWSMKQEMKSPNFTTQWSDLALVM